MKSRKQAISLNEKHYFTGKPCSRGHISERFTISRKCKVCAKLESAEYKFKNPETVKYTTRKASSKWQKNNLDIACFIKAKRRSAKLQRTPNWLTSEQHEQIKNIYKMAKELETVFPWKQHVDHMVPLQGKTVSGFHHPDNLQILSAKANAEKHNTYEVA